MFTLSTSLTSPKARKQPVGFTLLTVAACVLLFSFLIYFPWYWYREGGAKPLYWYFALSSLSAMMLFSRKRLVVPVPGSIGALYSWFILFLSYSAFSLFWADGVDGEQVIVGYVQFSFLTVCTLYLFSFPQIYKLFPAVLILAVMLATLINLFDFIAPIFTKVGGRAAGFYENPMIAGKVIALAMVPSLLFVRPRWRLLFIIFCGVGVLVTFSRAAWLLWGVGVFFAIYYGLVFLSIHRKMKLILATIVLSVLVTFLFSGLLGHAMQNYVGEYLTGNTLQRLGAEGSPVRSQSTDTRINLVRESLAEVNSSPVFGKGVGYTDSWSGGYRPHNMYMLSAVEGGLIGLAIFAALIAILWWPSNPVSRIFAVQFAVSGLFSHNNLEQPAVGLIMAFVVVSSASGAKTQRVPDSKPTPSDGLITSNADFPKGTRRGG